MLCIYYNISDGELFSTPFVPRTQVPFEHTAHLLLHCKTYCSAMGFFFFNRGRFFCDDDKATEEAEAVSGLMLLMNRGCNTKDAAR